MTSQSDAQLIERALQGNERAFRLLVERHHPTAYAVVRSVLGNSDTVEDVVQEVFIKVYRGLHTFRLDARFSTWLYRIARNEAISSVRRRRLQTTPVEDTVLVAPDALRPDEQYRRRSEQSELGRLLDRLDERHRTVLELRYMGEKSYAEIGEIMELPMGTVKSYIHRAKAELREIMMREKTKERA